ncbi:hypothetical protein HDU99_004069, partial [Rhizoclosmatium hyalinum]
MAAIATRKSLEDVEPFVKPALSTKVEEAKLLLYAETRQAVTPDFIVKPDIVKCPRPLEPFAKPTIFANLAFAQSPATSVHGRKRFTFVGSSTKSRQIQPKLTKKAPKQIFW